MHPKASDCSLHASDASEADSRSHTRFPLTPTLSLGERERPCARVRRWRGPWFVERWEVVLPLPKGEGWGEGEVRVRPSPCAVEDLCKVQSLCPAPHTDLSRQAAVDLATRKAPLGAPCL